MVVLSWLNFHPGHTPEDIAKGLRAEEDVDEIERLCAGCVAARFIEPTPWPRGAGAGHGPLLR